MYWPTGVPKVYSLSRYASATNTAESNDGIEEEVTEEPKSPSSEKAKRKSQNTSSIKSPRFESTSKPIVDNGEIVAAEASRSGSNFFTITKSRLTVWQAKPVLALAGIIRSPASMKAYGYNVALLLRPDALTVTIQTSLGFLISYLLYTDPSARVYQTRTVNGVKSKRESTDGTSYRRSSIMGGDSGAAEGDGIREVSLRFRMVVRIDAGIHAALALDSEIVIATQKPPAVQCIVWAAEDAKPQTRTELFTRMPWYDDKSAVTEMFFDRPMKLMIWLNENGKAYAVQSIVSQPSTGESFRGHLFHKPEDDQAHAIKVAVSPRFSLVALGRKDGTVDAYVVKDYAGNITKSHQYTLPMMSGAAGDLNCISFSPDGHCLFAAYEKGWVFWSIYGKVCATSFTADTSLLDINDERWSCGVDNSFWVGNGCEIALINSHDDRVWVLDIARIAAISSHTSANISHGLLQCSESLMIYKGHDVPDLTALSSDVALWSTIQIPSTYLVNQWPIKMTVISPDGKYIAIAGKRGLAHYSIVSGKWKTFDHPANDFEFSVRGGMCWYQHVLIACIEIGHKYQIRLYSREKTLDFSHILHTENISAPVIHATTSGPDSLLVYTLENNLLHYIIVPHRSAFKIVQVGQIGFHGIIRAPPRVRAISWLLPEDQLEYGDPSQDVAAASVLFLVDGKLVLLQPSTNEVGEVKYDMRVIIQNTEFFLLARDMTAGNPNGLLMQPTPGAENWPAVQTIGHSLRDSLWCCDATGFFVWTDLQDVVAAAPADLGRELPAVVRISLDFYPLSVLVTKGIVLGMDAELVQRRDIDFSFFRFAPRTQLFLPQVLRHHLAEYNSPAAIHLARSYEHLPYLEHALEILLHQILDSEVDNPPESAETALLPTAVSFLSSFPAYLDIIVNCTRKTELRSWKTLFAYLPPVLNLFEDSLAQDKLKTAAGYLLVLHAFRSDTLQQQEFARVLQKAAQKQDWDLCRELARFLLGIDASGQILRDALGGAGMTSHLNNGEATELLSPKVVNGREKRHSRHSDYFSASHNG